MPLSSAPSSANRPPGHRTGEREVNFDGLVGPTHNYAGLSRGNLASQLHKGQVSNPKQAALQGLAKMWRLVELGVAQAVLPPQPRPDLETLRRLGFYGDDAEVLAEARRQAPQLLVRCSSASPMWTANAATVAASADTLDGRVHVVPANLATLFHRQIEARTTTRVLRAIFADARHFVVHDPLPAWPGFADEGAANHTRLTSNTGTVHLFGWGRTEHAANELFPLPAPTVHPARQSLEACQAVARLNRLPEKTALFWQQHPHGIDGGAFHSDVVAVGNGPLLILHETAFAQTTALLERLRQELGPAFRSVVASEAELPLADAVRAYPFNSQIVTLPDGSMCIVAPTETEQTESARNFLERVRDEDNPVTRIEYLDVRQSMANGGGPACLRLRVPLSDDERMAIGARVFLDEALRQDLQHWIERHYRDRLEPADLSDPLLIDEGRRALDELTRLLALGPIYEFQGASDARLAAQEALPGV